MCPVVDVNDLVVAERFWSAVTGWPVRLSRWNEEYSEIGDGAHSLLLQLVPEAKAVKNRMHLDFRVQDVAVAVTEVVELGGGVVKPSAFIRTWSGNLGDTSSAPTLEWAVVADPFGNEFCVIKPAVSPQSSSTPTSEPSND
jgi:predicted enzyme related to lactoylglutathione lyase